MNDLKPEVTHDKPVPERAPDTGIGQQRAAFVQARSGPVLALVALAFCIGLTVAAYFSWSQLQQLISQQAAFHNRLDDIMRPLRSSMQELSSQAQLDRQRIDRQVEQLREEQQGIGQRLSSLAALLGRSEQGWGLAEVQYLLRIANQRLLLQRDVQTAKAALRSADLGLRELADPHYLGVREQIAAELESLEAVPAVDREGIYASLHACLERIDELPVAGTDYQPPDQSAAPGHAVKTVTSWKELPALIWASISDLFRLRDHEQPLEPMLPPERSYFLRENVRLQLTSARLALLRDDLMQYREALETARGWVSAHFAKDSAPVAALVAQLGELAAINIRPDLPDISTSLSLLRQRMKLSEQQTVLPPVSQDPAADLASPPGDQESAEASAP